MRFCETKGETIARCVHCLGCRLQHDNEHYRAFMATNELSSFLATMNNNARYDRSTNVLELEVNARRTIGILGDELLHLLHAELKFEFCRELGCTQTGIRWSLFSVLEDLEFADDIALPSHTWTHMQQKSSRLNDRASTIGLRINADKTKVM